MEFPERPWRNDKTFCCVYNCDSKAKRNRKLSFHYFPKKGLRKVTLKNKWGKEELVDSYKAWMLRLKMGKPASIYMKVCSLHFTKNDYVTQQHNTDNILKRCPKKTAVPSVNLPSLGSVDTPKPRNRKCRYDVLETIEKILEHDQNEVRLEELLEDKEPEPGASRSYSEEEMNVAKSLLVLCQSTFQDIGIQVNTDLIHTVSDLIKTEEQLNSMTGLHSFALLDVIETLVKSLHTDKRLHRLTLRDRIILTFLKLKNDISYVVLSILFGNITSQSCKTVFYDMVQVISQVLSAAIDFPSKDEVVSNLPNCFKNFSDVRVVLDCTEIFVQCPKCLCCRLKTYSHYKSSQTW